MAVDNDYLEELMKSIEPAIYPDGVPRDEDEDDGNEEVFGEGEEFADEYEMELASIPEKPSANQPSESEVQVESALEEIDSQVSEVEAEVQLDFGEPEQEEANEAVDDNSGENGEVAWDDIGSGNAEPEQPEAELEEIELDMSMSEEEIDAMLNAAKSSAEEEKIPISDSDDVADLLSLFGDDSDISDIKETLDKADNNIAVDQSALDEPEVAIPDLDEEEKTDQEEGGKKAKKKREKKQRVKKQKGTDEAAEGEEGAVKEKKPGLFSKLFGALTEEVPDDEPAVPETEETGVTDENAQILSELDAEDKGKKKKKKKKKDKGKKEQPETEGSERDIRDKEDGEEEPEEDKKKKKPKKEKKKKEPKPEDTTPSKKLPRKRVRLTFLFAFSVLAAVLILSFFLTDYIQKKQARFAYDNAEYEKAYSDLYGMDLNEEEQEIFKKSRVIMILQRKVDSYENYMQLGMKAEALNALLEGYDLYPSVMEKAEEYGVREQVKESYDKLVEYLATFGLSTLDAEEINGYTSAVQYNKRILSIVNNTPFEYGYSSEENVDEVPEAEDVVQTVEDILPEEEDFLPDNPEDIFEQ